MAHQVADQDGWILVLSKRTRRQAERRRAAELAALALADHENSETESEADTCKSHIISVSSSVSSSTHSAEDDVWLKEIPYVPKTSSCRATQKWAQGRKGSVVTVKDDEGFFVYGS